MAPFYILSVFLLLGALIKPAKQKFYFYTSFSILFVLLAFREYSVGTDTEHYLFAFERIVNEQQVFMEFSWVYLNELIISLGGDFRYVLVCSSLLVLVPVFYVIKKTSVNPMLSIFLYFTLYIYFSSFNITRQMIAVSIVFIGVSFIVKNRKPWLYFLLVLLAATFHTSALLALPLIFVNKVTDRIGVYISAMLLSMVIGLFFISPIAGEISGLLGYDTYLLSRNLGNLTGNALFLIILNTFFIFIIFTCKNRGILFKLFFIFIIAANLTSRIYLGSRLISYFAIFQVLFLPYYLYNTKLKDPSLPFIIVIAYAYILFIKFSISGSGEIFPYSNILF